MKKILLFILLIFSTLFVSAQNEPAPSGPGWKSLTTMTPKWNPITKKFMWYMGAGNGYLSSVSQPALKATADSIKYVNDSLFALKVDKITNKKLSTKDYSNTDSLKLAGLNPYSDYAIAYVDTLGNNSTAILGRQDKPFATIGAAITALPVTGGTVKIGIGRFVSPDSTLIKSHLLLIGSKKPEYNWVVTATNDTLVTYTAPTKLINGTILVGYLGIVNKTEVKIYNLGVDAGPAYIASGGTLCNCIGVGRWGSGNLSFAPPYLLSTGIEIKNCIVLGSSPTADFHDIIVESALNPIIEDVTTCYNTNGIVVKSVGGIINNVNCYSHGAAGIVVKSNSYAIASKITVSNFFITSISGKEGGGLIIQTQGSHIITDVVINNGHIFRCWLGISTLSSPNVVFNNVISSYCLGDGFQIDAQAIFTNCTAHHNSGYGFYLYPTDVNSSVSNTRLNGCKSLYNSLSGIYANTDGSNRIYFLNSESSYNKRYGIEAASNVYALSGTSSDENTLGIVSGTITNLYEPPISVSTTAKYWRGDKTWQTFPSIPSAQIQSDWNQSNTGLLDYIKNKPSIPSVSGLVPYTGATSNVDLGTRSITANSVIKLGADSTRALMGDGRTLIIKSGNYAPTFANTTNITNSLFLTATYTRIGNVVHVRISGTISATAAMLRTVLGFTLPVNTSQTSQVYVGVGAVQGSSDNALFSSGSVIIDSASTGYFYYVPNDYFGDHPFSVEFDYSL